MGRAPLEGEQLEKRGDNSYLLDGASREQHGRGRRCWGKEELLERGCGKRAEAGDGAGGRRRPGQSAPGSS